MSPEKLKSFGRKFAKTLLIGAALYIIIISLPWSCGLCGEDNIGQSYSPDGRHLARAYVRNCGATTDYLTHANLISRWRWFNTSWVGTITDGQVFANDCWSKVDFVWKDNANLEIRYERCAPRKDGKEAAFMKESSWEGINISYREMPSQVENK